MSLAVFSGDDLFECVDMEAVGTVGPAAVERTRKGFKDDKTPGRTVTELSTSCAEQFRDRHPFAVCLFHTTAAPDAAANGLKELTLRSSTYSFAAVFKADLLMKDCMKGGGKWTSMDRNSDEFREAQLQFGLADMEAKHKKVQRELSRAARQLEDDMP